MKTEQLHVDVESIVAHDTVLAIHEHPLLLVDLQRRKDAVALFGLSKTFACLTCHQLRHRFVRYCATCDVRCCQQCYNEASAEQTALISQSISTQLAINEEKNRRFAGNHRDTSNDAGISPFMAACIGGDFAAVREIVEKNEFSGTLDLEDLCEADDHKGQTAIALASAFGHRQIVMLLLSRGANPRACDNLGMTPLMHAAYGGHVEVLDELLFAGVEVDQTAFCGYTSLLFAACKGHALCVQRLAAAGASVASRTPKGRTPLIVAALNGHRAAVDILLKYLKPGEVAAADFEGYSALDAAIAKGHFAVESLLRTKL